MIEKILLIDDDELLLSSYRRTLRRQLLIDTACGGLEALDRLKSGERYAVILSDLRMPGMNGLEVLRQAHELSPDSVRMILTGNADLRTAIDAVNEGNIFRFLEKPCTGETLLNVLTAAIHQYRLIVAEKDLLENTLHGAVKVLTQVLELTNPEASTTASRIAAYARHLVAFFGLKDAWQFEVAALLSQLGSAVLADDACTPHQEIAYDLLRKIPRLEVVANMIRRSREAFRNQSQVPLNQRDAETIGAQILRASTAFERLVRQDMGFAHAVDILLAQTGEYDPALVAAFRELPVSGLPYEPRTVRIKDLTLRMVLNEEVRTTNGTLLVCKGVEVTDMLLARLWSFHERQAIGDSIRVLVPVSARLS
jgi:response regulator RpfG family c-di-GMP phosphodiesterase